MCPGVDICFQMCHSVHMTGHAERRVNGATWRLIRERSGLDQSQMARLLSCDRSHVSNIENGRKQPSPALIQSFAKVTGSPLAAVVCEPEQADAILALAKEAS